MEPLQTDSVTSLLGPACEKVPAPSILCDLISEMRKFSGESPQLLAAAALSVLSLAIGPKMLLRTERQRVSVLINLVISHIAPRSLPWLDCMTAEIVSRALKMETELTKKGVTGLKTDIEKLEKAYGDAQRGVNPNPELLKRLKSEADSAHSWLKPATVSTELCPKQLGTILQQSFDHGVTILSVGNDPGADFLRLKPSERARLCEQLNRSWNDLPLSLGSMGRDGKVSLLWQTRQSLSDLLSTRGFDSAYLPLPCLFFQSNATGGQIPLLEVEQGWRQLLARTFDQRLLNQQVVVSLAEEGATALAAFAAAIATNIDKLPSQLRAHADWLPDLAAKIASIVWFVENRSGGVIDSQTVENAVIMTKWIARKHLASVDAIQDSATAANADKPAILLAKIREKAPVSRRNLRRTFDNQRVRWFDEALDALIANKRVRYTENGELIACE